MTEKECKVAVDKSRTVIRQAFKDFKVEDMAITWTGGKDSTLGLWIIRRVCQEDGIKIPKVMTIDEFDVFHTLLRKE